MSIKAIDVTLNGSDLRLGFVVGRFNGLITSSLLDGAVDAARKHGVRDEDMAIVHVSGAFEIPLVAKKMAETGRFDAIVALGAVIRGATPHFDYVAGQAARGILQASMDSGVPIIFGVLTTESIEQALERAGTKAGNKGAEASVSAIETASVLAAIGRECG